MPSLERFIAVLRLFDEQATTWTVPAMAEALGIPQSTIYRTVRSLLVAGMLEAATEGRYRLGPAFIAFDRLIRLTDPLVEAGRDVLRDIAADAGVPCVALLSRLYNDTVMCIAEQSAGAVTLHSSYERGKPMPLTQGATSKVILAHLPRRRLARLLAKMDNAPRKLAAAGGGGIPLGTRRDTQARLLHDARRDRQWIDGRCCADPMERIRHCRQSQPCIAIAARHR